MTRESDSAFSRRDFIKTATVCVAGLAAWRWWSGEAQTASLVIVDNAKGIIIGDPTKCVTCHRCELACSEFNNGQASLSQARLKINRRLVTGAKSFFVPAHGPRGGDQVVMDLCRQCPHPVPCALACPREAIVLHPQTGARFVDKTRCDGCKLCLRACPWGMISFNEEQEKADKCFLCHGAPKCVEACPAEALKYRPWVDLTRDYPPGQGTISFISPRQAETCLDCHK